MPTLQDTLNETEKKRKGGTILLGGVLYLGDRIFLEEAFVFKRFMLLNLIHDLLCFLKNLVTESTKNKNVRIFSCGLVNKPYSLAQPLLKPK